MNQRGMKWGLEESINESNGLTVDKQKAKSRMTHNLKALLRLPSWGNFLFNSLPPDLKGRRNALMPSALSSLRKKFIAFSWAPKRDKSFVCFSLLCSFYTLVSVGKQHPDKNQQQGLYTWQYKKQNLGFKHRTIDCHVPLPTPLPPPLWANSCLTHSGVFCLSLSTEWSDVNRKWWGKLIWGKHFFFFFQGCNRKR